MNRKMMNMELQTLRLREPLCTLLTGRCAFRHVCMFCSDGVNFRLISANTNFFYILKRLDRNLPVLFVNGSGDVLSGLEEAKWNYEAAKGPKELIVIESVTPAPKRMEEAIANHVFKGKENEVVNRMLFWLHTRIEKEKSGL